MLTLLFLTLFSFIPIWPGLPSFVAEMGRGRAVTAYERGRITELIALGLSDEDIAIKLGRSSKLVRNCRLRGPDQEPGRSPGRKRKLDERDVRHIEAEARRESSSSRSIASALHLNVSHVTVWRTMKSSEHLEWRKLHKRPRLSKEHKAQRLDFAEQCVTSSTPWNSVIFSDEKRFNLDGPDGCTMYWHDLRFEERSFFTRQGGGKSVIIWCAISQLHRSPIVVIDGTLDSKKYVNILKAHLLPFVNRLSVETGQEATFQQDNAPVHNSEATTDWLNSKGITYLDWPPYSPDLNPIENVFGLLAKAVYAGNRQFDTVQQLTERIELCWDELDQAHITSTIASMPKRMFEVAREKGGSIDY
jgi:transposase